MASYIYTRIFTAILVVFGVSTLVFFLIHFIPGDPVEVMLGESARASDREALRQALGLNEPLIIQWLHFMKGMMSLDFGTSLHTRQPVIEMVFERVPATLQLTGFAMLFALIIAFPLGIMAAIRRNTPWDHGAMMISLTGVSIPNFLMGPLLILFFAVYLGWFPVSGRDGLASVVLPALTLGTAMAAILSRMIRATLLEVLNEDYIRTAYAKGMNALKVTILHALPNAMLPLITLMGLQLGALLAGAVITEVVFSWPGIGQLTIDAIQKRDYPLVQACVLLISISYVMVNMLTDLLYGVLDPRIRISATAKPESI